MADIMLTDIFRFDNLLSQPNYKGKRIKLRFNKNWGDFNFVKEYQENSDLFIPYLLSMHPKRNNNSDIQFHFIEVRPHLWLFVGAYNIIRKDSEILRDHFRNWDVVYAKAERLTEFDKYINRIIINYSLPSRSFFYVDKRIINSVPVSEILSEDYFEKSKDFPGYENISLSYQELKQHLHSSIWYEHLTAVYGVYLITDIKTGKMYVGSAYGNNGVYGRWSVYLSDGYDKTELEGNHYPNKKLREVVNKNGIRYIQKNFRYTLLEIFSKNELGKQKALNREIYWKDVLQTRMFGYNIN